MITVLIIAGIIFCTGVCVTGMAVTTAAFYILDK